MTQQNERTFYGPQLLTVAKVGNPDYGPAWAFQGQDGFWKAPRDQPNMQLVRDQSYMVTWTVKPNPPNKPYMDIVSAVLPDGQVARYDPQGNMVPGPAGPVVTSEQAADWATNPPGADYYNEADNPEWEGIRRFINRRFAPRAIEERRARARQLTAALVDLVIEKGECDFVDDLFSLVVAPLGRIPSQFGATERSRNADRARNLPPDSERVGVEERI